MKIFCLGGCAIHLPLRTVARRGAIDVGVFRRLGFRGIPQVLTPRAITQLIDFCAGAVDIPVEIQRFCFINPVRPPAGPAGREAIGDADLALVELVTPNEILFRGYALNANYLFFEVARLRARDPDLARAAQRWMSAGLWRRNEKVREREGRILRQNLRIETPQDELLLAMTEEARGILFGEAEIEAVLRDVERRLAMPIAMALHVPRYMPDGRPVSWPPGFDQTMRSVSGRLGWPTFDPAPIVAAYGVERALGPHPTIEDQLTHYRPAFESVMGEALHEFILSSASGARAAPAKA